MTNRCIGIDLGTSNACVAWMQEGRPVVFANRRGDQLTPSVVRFEHGNRVTIGSAARAAAAEDPAHTIYSAKRLIGRYFFSEEVARARALCSYSIVEGPRHSIRVPIYDRMVSIPEVSALVLRKMKAIAEAAGGFAVDSAVLTVPAHFNDNQRQATKEAGRIAGLDTLRILNEPTAAALAYGFGRGLTQRVAVYDLGGGTFDISVLRIENDVFEVLSTCGDTFLGGDDFDDRIIDLLADEYRAASGGNLRSDPSVREKLRAAAEKAKKALSFEEEVTIHVNLEGAKAFPERIERLLTRREFARLVEDLVQRTFKVCDEALQAANLTVHDLDGIILVGGPTRLPMIRDAAENYFQQQAHSDVNPDQVVAVGAAIHAASLSAPSPEVHLFDVAPLDLRIGVAGGLAEPIIERNTPVPIEQTRRFTTLRDYQESVQIRVYQGSSRAAPANQLLGCFEFSEYQKGRRGDVAIDVSFAIDHEGIVSVTASDPQTGARVSKRITLSDSLFSEERDSILDAERALADSSSLEAVLLEPAEA